MTIKELAEKCIERKIECEGCPYKKKCDEFSNFIEEISPAGLLDIFEETI